jgi:predicted nucleic acid-binding protein
MIVDTGPLVSLMNRQEGHLHEIAQLVIQENPRRAIVPWPVYAEADLVLRGKGFPRAARQLGDAMLAGELQLEAPTDTELGAALELCDRYSDIGLDLPDAVVIAMASRRSVSAFTWDFRHFRAVVVERNAPVSLAVQEFQVRRH